MTLWTRLWKGSERIGFVPTVLCAIAWLAFGVIAVRVAGASLWPTPKLAFVVVIVISAIIGIGGLLSYWLIADHVDYRVRGYRVRCVTGNDWLYEERVSKGTERCLPCVRVVLGYGSAEVFVPSEASWETRVPLWARGRRSEIMERIALCFGSDRGAQIRFVDV